MHMFHTKCKASRVWSTLQLNVFWGVKHWCFLCWLAWKFLLRRKQSQLITEIRMISKKKGKRLLNKLIYFQSLSNRALYFKIKAKPAKYSLWMAKKRICLREKKTSKTQNNSPRSPVLLVRLEKARSNALDHRPAVQRSTAPTKDRDRSFVKAGL